VAFASVALDQGYPVSVNFSDDSLQIAVTTNLRTMLMLNSKNLSQSFKVEDVAQCFWSSWSQAYPLFTKPPCQPQVPIALANTTNAVFLGDERGNLYVWKSLESLQQNTGSCFSPHASLVAKLALTQDDSALLSLGASDGTVCQWKLQKLQENEVGGEEADEQWQQRTVMVEI